MTDMEHSLATEPGGRAARVTDREDKAPPSRWLYAHGDEVTVRYAAARSAQERWAKVPVRARARALSRMADVLFSRRDALAHLIHEENGKPEVEALGHEVGPCLAGLRRLAAHGPDVLRPRRQGLKWMPNRVATITPEPYGVVLIISPWNFPLSIPLLQVAAALLAGNAVVLKPSEYATAVGEAIHEIGEAAGLPPGLLTVVQGDGAVGAALVDARPDKIVFTGSVATGRKVMEAAGRHPIPVSLELGGVDALIVCDDADLELAASAAAWGSMMNGGQACASIERILVDESVREPFVSRVVHKLSEIDPEAELGPVVMPRQKAVYESHLQDARARGLTVRCGGTWQGDRKLAPTLIEGEGVEASEVYREETFGPIVAVATFRGDDDAVRKHNASRFGLTASVFSSSRERARAMAGRLHAGLVSINDLAATLHAHEELPWGGVGDSGFGRSHGVTGLLSFTTPRVLEETRPGLFEFKRPWWFPYGPSQTTAMRWFVQAVGERSLTGRARALFGAAKCVLPLFFEEPRR